MNYKSSMFNYFFTVNDRRYIYNTMQGTKSICEITKEHNVIFDILQRGDVSGINPEFREILFDKGILVQDEIDEISKRNVLCAKTVNDRILRLVIHTTRRCNFRCKYCCLDFKDEDLSIEIQDNIFRFIKHNIINYQAVDVNWFGGEPLMNVDAIINLSSKIKDICKSVGKVYKSSITTNGYLLSEKVVNKLVNVGVTIFFVTLDGLPEYHDKLRVLTNGEGTYNKIYQNLLNIKKIHSAKIKVNIRTNFTRDMMGNYQKIYRNLSNAFGDDRRFALYFRSVVDSGGERINQMKNQILNGRQINELENNLASINDGTINYDTNYYSLEPGGFICPAMKCGKYTIDTCGKVYKCDVLSEETELGYLNSYGKIVYCNSCEENWIGIAFKFFERCENCPVSPLCFKGVCPMQELINGEKLCILDSRDNKLDGLLAMFVASNRIEVI